jgi:uncharacterized protein DUF1566
MNSSARFTDNNNGSITDNKTGLTWTKEDTWQSEAKWVSWDEAKDHVTYLFQTKFCGNSDWRFPTTEEILSLYDPNAVNTDKYGTAIYLDPIFPSGCLPTVWTDGHFMGNEGNILDFRNGEIRSLYKSKSGRMAVRAVYDKKEPT